MILGRWSSDAFLDYIHPQVLEWTNLMAHDMAQSRKFLDLGTRQGPGPTSEHYDEESEVETRPRSQRR